MDFAVFLEHSAYRLPVALDKVYIPVFCPFNVFFERDRIIPVCRDVADPKSGRAVLNYPRRHYVTTRPLARIFMDVAALAMVEIKLPLDKMCPTISGNV